MPSHSCSVRIFGRDYTLATQDSPDRTQRIAAYVDRKITEIASGTIANREVSAVVAALSIAEELLDAQDENTRLRDALYQAQSEKSGERP